MRQTLSNPTQELDWVMGLAHCYEWYRYVQRGQKDILKVMSPSKSSDPPLNLVPLPRLRTLTVLSHRDIRRREREGEFKPSWRVHEVLSHHAGSRDF